MGSRAARLPPAPARCPTRARVSDPTLFQAFSQIAQSLPLEAFSAQNIANIVNALGKMGFRDLALLNPT